MWRQHPETGDSPVLEHRLAGSNGRGGVSRGRPALVSVVMPVRNAEPFLAEQLAALSQQTYPGRWELVAVDNGCTDRSIEVVEKWRPQLPEVRVVDASGRKSPNYARNGGAAAARGDLLAYCDADDVVDRGWLGALVEAAREAIGGGVAAESEGRGEAVRGRRRGSAQDVGSGLEQ